MLICSVNLNKWHPRLPLVVLEVSDISIEGSSGLRLAGCSQDYGSSLVRRQLRQGIFRRQSIAVTATDLFKEYLSLRIENES